MKSLIFFGGDISAEAAGFNVLTLIYVVEIQESFLTSNAEGQIDPQSPWYDKG